MSELLTFTEYTKGLGFCGFAVMGVDIYRVTDFYESDSEAEEALEMALMYNDIGPIEPLSEDEILTYIRLSTEHITLH